jgi:hypothetical protein
MKNVEVDISEVKLDMRNMDNRVKNVEIDVSGMKSDIRNINRNLDSQANCPFVQANKFSYPSSSGIPVHQAVVNG